MIPAVLDTPLQQGRASTFYQDCSSGFVVDFDQVFVDVFS